MILYYLDVASYHPGASKSHKIINTFGYISSGLVIP